MLRSPQFAQAATTRKPLARDLGRIRHHRYLLAREELMIRFLKVMADNHLDAIMYMEHQPTLLKDGASPPWVNTKGLRI